MEEGALAASYEQRQDFPNGTTGTNRSAGQVYGGTAGVSTVNGVERLAQREVLLGQELPCRRISDNSDSDINSAWARKTVLTLDGGGIKGYSSLLILKRVMKLVAEIEAGKRPAGSDDPWCWPPNHTSAHYPWFREPQAIETTYGTSALNNERAMIVDEVSDDEVEMACKDTKGTEHYFPRHYFDYIAGTSTGGLSAIMLGRIRMSIDDALAQYDTVGNQVFGNPRMLHRRFSILNYVKPKYRSRDMKKAVLEVVRKGLDDELRQWETHEEDTSLESDPAQCRTLAIAYGYHVAKGVKKSYIFRSYTHPFPSPRTQYPGPLLNAGLANREPLWKIARATSAAPRYFSQIDFSGRIFKDGGLGANNPAELALREVLQMEEHKPSMLVSVGTGKSEELSKQPKGSPAQNGFIRFRGDVRDVLALVTDSESTEERVHERCADLNPPVDYFRFNVLKEMSQIMLDDWEPAASGKRTKEHITRLTNQYLHKRNVNDQLLMCARKLVRIRRDRAKTERWERFAAQYVYFCPEKACKSKHTKTYAERKELRAHGIEKHFAELNTPFESSVKDGVPYDFPCPYNDCVHKIHRFHTRDQLVQHFREHHQLDTFKNAQELECWLDSGRTTQKEAWQARE
ncbi:MAG: hypothetical protein M1816_004291 [Peltula sp. TS41687]|nr:MAG: hypothetical protein M1816_004291 [Peltula sp. TS41687]